VNLGPVLDQLHARIGLSPEALGPSLVPAAVRDRMRRLGVDDSSAYAARLAGDPDEFQALVDEIVVPETWFFRGGALFPYLAQQIRQRAAPRTLSVPCSTGEEPYSLVIALKEAGVPERDGVVLGVDLSRGHVEHARRGRYGEFAFRQTPADLRGRYFRPVAGGWEIDPSVRAAVEIRQGNLLADDFLAGEPPFDLIFCRNLFIYLHPAARQRALAALERLLAPDGWLCMGHAEPLPLLDGRFQRVGPEGHFLYRRAEGPSVRDAAQKRSSTLLRSVAKRDGRSAARRAAVPPPPPAPAPPAPDPLAGARRLADGGRLAEALTLCQTLLAGAGPSADLFSLTGVIHQARQEPADAARCFRQALYLQPDHPEALLHLMVWCRQQGDHAQADLLRRRLGRSSAGGDA
jgi:chemotaxis protein methyltransferase WspC